MADEILCYVQIKNPDVNVYRDNSQDIIVGHTSNKIKINVTEISPDKQYYYSPAYEGWIASSNITILQSGSSPINDSQMIKEPETKEVNIEDEELVTGSNSAASSVLASLAATDTVGIFALPYQFMKTTDRRLKESSDNGVGEGIGRKYAEKILSRGNLLYLTPGRQEFMAGASSQDRSNMLSSLANMAAGFNVDLDPRSIVTTNARYYSLAFDYDNYFRYVDTACSATAVLMGIGSERVIIGGKSTLLKDVHWQDALSTNSQFTEMLGAHQNIIFYVDGLNSISESFGNSTRESSLVSQINGYSDTVKEINYIMNFGNNASALDALSDENYASTMSEIQNTVNSFASGTGVLQAILGNSTTVLSGGKLVFPELWSDSDYDRSYSVDIKLRSPEADDLSIFLNIIVPYIHLMALTAPRDFDGKANSNGYVAPFLVRAFFRSLFNIDMGIITDLSVNKGGEGNWAATSNLPTSIDVSITIKDLYKSMYMSSSSGLSDSLNMAKFVANDGEIEQLMTLSGMSSQFLSPADRWKIYEGITTNNMKGLFGRFGDRMQNDFANAIARFF